MSDEHDDIPLEIDLKAQLTRIDLDIAETAKLTAETRKLLAEAEKLKVDRWVAPGLAMVALVGGLLGVATFIAHLMGH